jgi:hypothetical protein
LPTSSFGLRSSVGRSLGADATGLATGTGR